MEDDLDRRIVNRITLARGDAMLAGAEWYGVYRYDVARSAGDDMNIGAPDEGEVAQELRAEIVNVLASTAANAVLELPPATEYPQESEVLWRLRVSMYAAAVGKTDEEADVELREDFKEYVRLLNSLLEEWRQQDVTEGRCSLPGNAYFALCRFLCGRCARTPESVMEQIRSLHKVSCCKRRA